MPRTTANSGAKQALVLLALDAAGRDGANSAELYPLLKAEVASRGALTHLLLRLWTKKRVVRSSRANARGFRYWLPRHAPQELLGHKHKDVVEIEHPKGATVLRISYSVEIGNRSLSLSHEEAQCMFNALSPIFGNRG